MQFLAYDSAARFGPLKLSCQTKLKQPSEINYLHIYCTQNLVIKKKRRKELLFISSVTPNSRKTPAIKALGHITHTKKRGIGGDSAALTINRRWDWSNARI
jgi:hypothetical protein